MTSLKGFLPPAGSALWRKDRGRLSSESEGSLSPSIKHVVIREVWQRTNPSPHALYKIDVMTKSNHWFIFRRYREFYELHKNLVALYGIPKDMLPPKKLTSNMALCHLEKRKAALEHYLQRLANSSTYVSTSPEILEFLEVQRHDVMAVTKSLARDLFQKGREVLAKGESFTFSPTQLYCVTRQLQLPEPGSPMDQTDAADLGNLYDFVYQLQSLCVSSIVNKSTTSQELSSHLEFDISLFKSLSCLIIDGCPLTLINNLSKVQSQITSLTARYCLTNMKELLVDCAAEKRSAPKVKGPVESWRGATTAKLMQNRVVVQPWHQLTHLILTHNKLVAFDTSLKLLPVLQNLDLSYNEFVHLDLQQLCCPSLMYLNLSHNNIHFITGMPGGLAHLKSLVVSHNNLETVSGLDSLTGLIELNIEYNQIYTIHEVSKLCLNSHLKYLCIAGNPFARAKPYRMIVLSFFKGKELILDKKPITKKERMKLRSHPTKLRASTSPDQMLDDEPASEDGLASRRYHSLNLFGPSESDDDSGIEGAPILASNSVIIDPEESEILDKELPFNWLYYPVGNAVPVSNNITCLPSEDSGEEQKDPSVATNSFVLENANTARNEGTECYLDDHDSIKSPGTFNDKSTTLGSTSTLEAEESVTQCCSPLNPNASVPTEQLSSNSTLSADDVHITQHNSSGKSESADGKSHLMSSRANDCQQLVEKLSLHNEGQQTVKESISVTKPMSGEPSFNAKQTVFTSDHYQQIGFLPNPTESLLMNDELKDNSPQEG